MLMQPWPFGPTADRQPCCIHNCTQGLAVVMRRKVGFLLGRTTERVVLIGKASALHPPLWLLLLFALSAPDSSKACGVNELCCKATAAVSPLPS